LQDYLNPLYFGSSQLSGRSRSKLLLLALFHRPLNVLPQQLLEWEMDSLGTSIRYPLRLFYRSSDI
jgi:hypothetical protein